MGLGRWTTGSAVGTGGQNGMRLAWRIDQSPSSVGTGTSSVSLRLRIRVETRRSVYDSSNSFSVSGSWPSVSTNVSISHSSATSWSSQNRTIVYDRTITVSTSYTATRNRSFSASLSGINAAPGTARVSGSRTVPRRPISPPNTPSNVNGSRNNDSSHRITWSQSTSSARPVTGFRIQRRTFGQNGWGGWSTRTSNVSSGSRAWTDTGTRNNRVYQWRVVAVNSAGTRTSSSTGSLWTTPYVPTQVSARRISGDRIRLDWRDAVTYGSSDFQIRHSENGGSWSDIATHSGGSYDSAQSWTHSSPNLASTHEYAIRSRTTSMSPTLSSSWVYSNLIQLAAPPNAPTITGPTVAVDAQANAVRVTWRHNPTDGSDQDSYQIRWRYEGDTSWNTLSREYSETEAHTFAAGLFENDRVVQVQVRTWGAHGDPGPYSSQFTFSTSSPPTVAINYPDPAEPVHHEAHITTQWEYAGNVGQSHWEAELYRPDPEDLEAQGTLMERRTGTGTASSVRFNRRLPDDTLWRIRVRTRAGDGLWSEWDQVDFEVSYPLPAVPSGRGNWDSDMGAVTLNVDEGVMEEDEEPTAQVQMYRPGQSFFEGPAREIATARAAAEEYGLPEGFYAENLVTNPRGRMTEGEVTVQRNLIPNPSFETGTHGVFTSGTATANQTTLSAYAGDYSLTWSIGEDSTNTQGWVRQDFDLPEDATGWVGFSAVARRSVGPAPSIRWFIQFLDSSGTVIYSAYLSELETTTDRLPDQPRWTDAAEIVEGAVSMTLWMRPRSEEPRHGVIHTDAWMACVAPTQETALAAVSEYFDGDTWDGDPDFSPQWEGEPHESPSRLIAPVPVGWEGSDLYYSEVNDAVAIPASAERQALVEAIQNYTDADIRWSTSAPSDTSAVWVDSATGVAREWSAGVGGSTEDVVTRRNLVPNPSFETGTSGLVTGAALDTTDEWSVSGSRSLRAEWADGAGNVNSMLRTDSIPDVAGKWIAWSLWVRRDSGSVHYRGLWQQYDGSSSYGHTGPPLPMPEETERFVLARQVSSEAEWIRVGIQTSGSPNVTDFDGSLLTDAWIVCVADTEQEALAAVETYFDGDTPEHRTDNIIYRYAWEGTPHASPSTETALGQGWHEIIDLDVVTAGQAYATSFVQSPHESVQGTLAVHDVDANTTVYRDVDGQAQIIPTDQTRYIRVAVVEGEYDGPVFDGSDEQEGVNFEWTGDEDESTSLAYLEWEALLEEYFEQYAVPVGPTVEPGTSITDYIPPLNEVVPYRVEALTELGASQVSEIFLVETSPTSGWLHLNAGPGFSEHVRIRYNPDLGRERGRAKTTHHFAGRELEAEVAGEARTLAGTLSTEIIVNRAKYRSGMEPSTPDELEEFADFAAPACLRIPEPLNRWLYVSLGEVSVDQDESPVAVVSVPWRRVGHDESVRLGVSTGEGDGDEQ